MKSIASNRLEDWLEEDEDINKNSEFRRNTFYNENENERTSTDKRENDSWI